jgi:ABC-type proline/glycine betaine transport system substrate-binding protein
LFPGLTNKFKFKITYTAPKEEALPVDTVASDMPNVKISIRAFSQNFGSDPIDLVLADYIPADELRRLNEENQKKIKDQKASLQKKFEEVRPELEAGMQEARRAMKQFPFITRPRGE